MFWLLAAAALFTGALITLIPLLSGKSLWKPVALALVFALPALGMWMYRDLVGTPVALDMRPAAPVAASDAAHADSAIENLRSRLLESPENLDGWLLLGRTLKTVQRYQEAVDALKTAMQIAPNNPAVLVELAEARIFVSRDGRIGDEEIVMLERALELDPLSQKALWLMGIASLQAGDNRAAIDYWQSLLDQLEPGSTIARSIAEQIDQARAEMGLPASPGTPPATPQGWNGLQVVVNANEETRSALPTGGVLYVMVRGAGPAAGPPIGVRRLEDPVLPVQIRITDQDSMMEERLISAQEEVQVQARLSRSGSPAARPGDWQSSPKTVLLDSGQSVELLLDQEVE